MAEFLSIDRCLIILWGAAAAALVVTLRWMRSRSSNGLASLARGEEGAGYTVSLLLCLPIYSLLVAALVESSLLLIVSLGVSYAAHATTRAAMVWLPAECDEATRRQKIEDAAAHALTPFASSLHAPARGASPQQAAARERYINAFDAYAGSELVPQSYLRAKFDYAASATNVTWSKQAGADDFDLYITYDAPIQIPGIAPFLGTHVSQKGQPYFTWRMESHVIVNPETPVSSARTLGIRYGQPH